MTHTNDRNEPGTVLAMHLSAIDAKLIALQRLCEICESSCELEELGAMFELSTAARTDVANAERALESVQRDGPRLRAVGADAR